MTLQLSARWASALNAQPETGMGYQAATVTLRDGRVFPRSRIVGGLITSADGATEIPFAEEDIVTIVINHAR